MVAEQIAFLVLTFIILVSGFIVVTDENLFHAALAMMMTFFGVAGFYTLLNAGFLAAAQLMVYIGAISILIIFAIMMTRRVMNTAESPFNNQWLPAMIICFGIVALFGYIIFGVFGTNGVPGLNLASAPVLPPEVLANNVVDMGRGFVDPNQYVIPFEVSSVLLLGALIGSIAIARPESES